MPAVTRAQARARAAAVRGTPQLVQTADFNASQQNDELTASKNYHLPGMRIDVASKETTATVATADSIRRTTPEPATDKTIATLPDTTGRKDTIMMDESMGFVKAVAAEPAPAESISEVVVFPRGVHRAVSSISKDILAQNQMLILQLEQSGALAPGVLQINPSSGLLVANLTAEPDPGTMAGLFPNMSPSPDNEPQIPSWLRDALIKDINVYGKGPPAACRALYDHLKRSQEETGTNTTVWTAEMLLGCAAMSLRHAVELVQDFVDGSAVYDDDDMHAREVDGIITCVERLVGCDRTELPLDLRFVLDMGAMGASVKEMMEMPLRQMVIRPYERLVKKLETISKALRMELDGGSEKQCGAGRDEPNSPGTNSDSGVEIGW